MGGQNCEGQTGLRSAYRNWPTTTHHFDCSQHPKVEVRVHAAQYCKPPCKMLAASGQIAASCPQAFRRRRVRYSRVIPTLGAKLKESSMPLVQVKVIKGVFDSSQKQDMISQLTETMVGIEGEALRGVTWVTIEEVESGDWGIGGNAIPAQYVKDLKKTPAVTR